MDAVYHCYFIRIGFYRERHVLLHCKLRKQKIYEITLLTKGIIVSKLYLFTRSWIPRYLWDPEVAYLFQVNTVRRRIIYGWYIIFQSISLINGICYIYSAMDYITREYGCRVTHVLVLPSCGKTAETKKRVNVKRRQQLAISKIHEKLMLIYTHKWRCTLAALSW